MDKVQFYISRWMKCWLNLFQIWSLVGIWHTCVTRSNVQLTTSRRRQSGYLLGPYDPSLTLSVSPRFFRDNVNMDKWPWRLWHTGWEWPWTPLRGHSFYLLSEMVFLCTNFCLKDENYFTGFDCRCWLWQ